MRLDEYIQKSLFPDIVPDKDSEKLSKWVFRIGNNNFKLDINMLDLIDHECSQIIKEYKKVGKVLYRGSKSRGRQISPNIYKAVPREDRRPKDTRLEHHEEMDDLFNKKFGWRVRSSGVFTSSKPGSAKEFGSLNLFLPVNGYKYVWSPQYDDLYSDFLEDLENKLEYEIDNKTYWIDTKTNEKYLLSDIIHIPGYRSYDYDEDNIIVTLYDRDDNGNNIEILLVRDDNIYIDDFRTQKMEDAVGTYENTELQRAILSSSEIVFKCKYYYLIPLNESNYFQYDKLKIENFGLGLGTRL